MKKKINDKLHILLVIFLAVIGTVMYAMAYFYDYPWTIFGIFAALPIFAAGVLVGKVRDDSEDAADSVVEDPIDAIKEFTPKRKSRFFSKGKEEKKRSVKVEQIRSDMKRKNARDREFVDIFEKY